MLPVEHKEYWCFGNQSFFLLTFLNSVTVDFNMNLEPIPLSKFSSLPAPRVSVDPGEAWICEEYLLLLQKNPITIAEFLNKNSTNKIIDVPPIEYPYVMSVYYRLNKSPNPNSKNPILVATLEKSRFVEMLEENAVSGLFEAGGHTNVGIYKGDLTLQSVREYFINLISKQLDLKTVATKIGVISDIYGHPATGWPAQKASKKPKGCLSVVALATLLVFSILISLMH